MAKTLTHAPPDPRDSPESLASYALSTIELGIRRARSRLILVKGAWFPALLPVSRDCFGSISPVRCPEMLTLEPQSLAVCSVP